MKTKTNKYIKGSIILLLLAICITGCTSTSSKTMTCTNTINQNNVKVESTYVVTYKKEDVTYLESTEKISTSDSSVLDTYEKTIDNIYQPYKNIEHYNYNITKENNTLISKVNADYENIDIDKLIEIDSSIKSLMKNNKINVKKMKSAYEQLGATCQG